MWDAIEKNEDFIMNDLRCFIHIFLKNTKIVVLFCFAFLLRNKYIFMKD